MIMLCAVNAVNIFADDDSVDVAVDVIVDDNVVIDDSVVVDDDVVINDDVVVIDDDDVINDSVDVLNVLNVLNVPNDVDVVDDTATIADTITQIEIAYRHHLYNIIELTAAAAPVVPNSNRINATRIFLSDGTDGSEILRYNAPTLTYIPFSLSSGMNRLLLYGNVAQNLKIQSAYAPRAPRTSMSRYQFFADRVTQGNMPAHTMASEFNIDPHTGITYTPYPYGITAPELHFMWENGVFNQNTFNVRISRPLTPSTMINIFANYRTLDGMFFDHERNDIVTFYESFYNDPDRVMNEGYNPHVDEQTIGAAVLHNRADASKLFLSFLYGNYTNEYAVDRGVRDILGRSIDTLFWAVHRQYTYNINAALIEKNIGSYQTNFRFSYEDTDSRSRFSLDTVNVRNLTNWNASKRDIVFDADVAHHSGVGLRGAMLLRDFEFSYRDTISDTIRDNTNENSWQIYRPEIFYVTDLLPRDEHRQLNLDLRVGFNISPEDSVTNIYTSDWFNAKLEYFAGNSRILARYTQNSELAKNQFTAEYEWQSHYVGFMVGYQTLGGIYENLFDSNRDGAGYWFMYAWPERVPPHIQSVNTFVLAPSVRNIGNFALQLRFEGSTDVHYPEKIGARLTHTARPRNMQHVFETQLGFDYWSEREPVEWMWSFADHTDEWYRPIYDVNLKITAHIQSFRLFYKIDNLLNIKQAYVPGYFSPGLTFRWGINWFIQ